TYGKSLYIERYRINGIVKNSILEILNIKTTQINVEITNDLISTKIIDRESPIYHIREKNEDFRLLDNVKIDLYYLNQSAKVNFTRKMGVRVVNFGSVFLFKNGFRVQPFGEVGDDSWSLDYRAQQGYNRFLGTRDILGKVEVITDDVEQFKEVSSRDGGLVETIGYHQLMNIFKEKALIRLERYVVGVLWGEGFKRRKYFGEGEKAKEIAEEYREHLKQEDKFAENTLAVQSNLGSKLDFIQIVKSLATNKNIEIVDYNRNFVNLINEKLEEHQTKFIQDLATIADRTNDKELKKKIETVEKGYRELQLEKEAAERKIEAEQLKRLEAEKKARQEEIIREKAEERERFEAEKRRAAELEVLKKEKERAEAELAKLKAEKEVEVKVEELKTEQLKTEFYRKQVSKDTDALIHHIKNDTSTIISSVENILVSLGKNKIDKDELIKDLSYLKFHAEKCFKAASMITHVDLAESDTQLINLAAFLQGYVKNYRKITSKKAARISHIDLGGTFKVLSSKTELAIIIDNLIDNAIKWNASQVQITSQLINQSRFSIKISDDGEGVSQKYSDDKNKIFNFKETNREGGSGLGLYLVKQKLEDMGAEIKYIGNGLDLKGALFEITFER
ncbi:MAG: ATP-binding protein, partial [Bacteroidota bacterium]